MHFNENVRELILKYTNSAALCKLSIGVFDKGNKETTMFDRGHEIDCSTSAIYEIGGITAAFTSSLMMSMVLERKISLDSKIGEYLSEVPKEKALPSLEQLASHTSGYPHMPFWFYWKAFLDGKRNINPYLYYTYRDMINYLSNAKSSYEKATAQQSSFDMGVLGCCLAAAEKIEFEDLLNVFVKDELNLPNTTLNVDFRSMIIGYNSRGRKSAAWGYQSMAGGLGLKSNINDLIEFARMNIYNEKPYFAQCQQIHSSSSSGEIKNFGYGWAINDNIIWLKGATGGHRAFLGFDKSREKAVCVMSNYAKDKGNVSVEKIGFALLD